MGLVIIGEENNKRKRRRLKRKKGKEKAMEKGEDI